MMNYYHYYQYYLLSIIINYYQYYLLLHCIILTQTNNIENIWSKMFYFKSILTSLKNIM